MPSFLLCSRRSTTIVVLVLVRLFAAAVTLAPRDTQDTLSLTLTVTLTVTLTLTLTLTRRSS